MVAGLGTPIQQLVLDGGAVRGSNLIIMSNKLIALFLMAMAAAAAAEAPPPVDFIAPELKAYLKMDSQQVKTINGLIGEYYVAVTDWMSDYLDLEDKIDSLRRDGTLEPQAIGLALADPIAAQITIERKVDAKLIETEKRVQATLNPAQKTLTAQFSAALALQPLIDDAFGAFILSESERPRNSVQVNTEVSPLSLRGVFQKRLAAARKERLARKL